MRVGNTTGLIAALRRRELDNLRIASRAHREAIEANFFGDDVACYDQLVTAQEATYTARLCAEEVSDLLANTLEGEQR